MAARIVARSLASAGARATGAVRRAAWAAGPSPRRAWTRDLSLTSAAFADSPASSSASSSSSGSAEAPLTHFGFRDVPQEEKKGLVGSVFHRVAESYDVMNDLMSGGLHRLWKDDFVRALGPQVARSGPTRFLDVAGGTGDIAFRIASSLNRSLAGGLPVGAVDPLVVVCDINPSMLRVGRDRALARGFRVEGDVVPGGEISFAAEAGVAAGDALTSDMPRSQTTLRFAEGDAEKLPFPDNTFDAYTIAFGIRNVTDVPAALREARRVLKPGGRFMCLEFSPVSTPGVAEIYDAYSFNVIPRIGAIVANDKDAYQYLVESIRRFPDVATFSGMIADAGFSLVRSTTYTLGVVAVHSAFKPLA